MMNLQTILRAARRESEERRRRVRLESLRHRIEDMGPTLGFARALAGPACTVIAEIKTKSPSMGRMSRGADETAASVHRIYQEHPVVSALSVLTQHTHFGGSHGHLRQVRREVTKPILRKDFIWDEYEVYFSRAIGADAILLMANVVTDPARFAALHDLATGIGLDVLCEIHTARELEVLPPGARVCGINSRNFESGARFLVSRLARMVGRDASIDGDAFALFSRLPAGVIKVAESGLSAENFGPLLRRHRFDAALIGTSLLKRGLGGVKAELDKIQAAIAAA
jgi:indole-3-glycerol phosphate synthase